MRAGQLRHRLQLQEYVEAKNTFGEATKAWSTFAEVWGAVMPLQGRERFSAQQVTPEVTHQIRIRHRAALETKHRIQFGQRTFNIESILNRDERNAEQTLLAVEEL